MAVVQAFVDTWNVGDMDAVRELLDPDVILMPVKNWPEPGPYMGREAAMGFYERVREGERVIARADWGGKGRTSGIDLRSNLTSVCTIRDGQITRMEYFFNHAEALEAAGLSE